MNKKKLTLILSGVVILIGILAGLYFLNWSKDKPVVEEPKKEVQEIEFGTEEEETTSSSVEEESTEEESTVEIIEPTMDGFVFDNDLSNSAGWEHTPTIKIDELTEEEISYLNIKKDAESTNGYVYDTTAAMDSVIIGLGYIQFTGTYSDAIYSMREVTDDFKTVEDALYGYCMNAANYVSSSKGVEIPFNTAFDIGIGLSNPKDFFEDERDWSIALVNDVVLYQVVYYFTEEIDLGKVTYLCTVSGNEENPTYYATGVLETEDGRRFVVSLSDSKYKYTYAYIHDAFTNSLVVVE